MKHLRLSLLLTILISMMSTTAFAHDFEVKNTDGVTIYYLKTNDTEVAVSYRGNYYDYYSNEYTGNVVIPESVIYNSVTYSVTSISNYAFQGCSGLTSITIPNSVASISNYAFQGCSGLTSITIPNSVASIGNYAFQGCSGLTSITIPNSVTSISGRTFDGCSGLISITIPNSVTSIGNYAFRGCSGLISITIPNSVTSIESYIFDGCSSLVSITIPNSVTRIGDYAFRGCSSLVSITIPNSVTTIGDYAFGGCSGLISITIPNSMKRIGSCAFHSCRSLTSVTIPNSVTSIGENAFYYCSSLTTVKVSVIDYSTFCNNKVVGAIEKAIILIDDKGNEIQKYVIPEDVTSIGDKAFSNCSGLTSITIPNSVTNIGEAAFSGCSKLESVLLPEDLSIIKKHTFRGCSSLKSIIIPSKVEYIYQEAFSGCNKLESVKALPENPPFMYENSFSKYDIPLYAPEASVAAYQSTSPWSKFASFKTLTGEDVEMKQCAKPTIKMTHGELSFECETEDVEFVYSLTPPAETASEGKKVALPTTYIISVYAKKEGYINSETVTEEIDVRGLKGDVDGDGVVDVNDVQTTINIILKK